MKMKIMIPTDNRESINAVKLLSVTFAATTIPSSIRAMLTKNRCATSNKMFTSDAFVQVMAFTRSTSPFNASSWSRTSLMVFLLSLGRVLDWYTDQTTHSADGSGNPRMKRLAYQCGEESTPRLKIAGNLVRLW